MADSLDTIFAPLSTPKTGTAAKPSLDDMFAPLTPGGVAPPKTFESTIRATDPTVDYETGAPVTFRYGMFKASNEREQKLMMQRQFGEGNYRKTPDGEWLYKKNDKWTAVYPKGVAETLKTGAAFGAAAAPRLAAPVAGAVLGAPAGPIGSVLGAAGASGLGYGLDELLHKGPTGTFSKTPMETLGEGGMEMLLSGMGQGAGPAWNAGKSALYGGTSALARKFAGVNPEAQQLAQGLERLNVTPPIGSVTRKGGFEFERGMRNQISGDPKAAGRVAAIDTRMQEILSRFGMQGPELQRAMAQIKTNMEKVSPTDASDKIMSALRTEETGLRTTEQRHIKIAEDALNRHYNVLTNTMSKKLDKNLGERVINDYELAGKSFRQDMNVAYGAATQATGDAPIITVPGKILSEVDPLSVPGPIKQLFDHESGDLRPMTFLEAHRLRTWLRDRAGMRGGDQAPIGQQAGDFHRMAGQVDEAMGEAATQHPAAEQARDLLKRADEQYKEGVVRFTNEKLNNLAWSVKQGRQPDPDEIAGFILNRGSASTTRQLWGMLSDDTKRAVETADLSNILNAGARVGRDGNKTVDPDVLLKALDERKNYADFVHDKRFFAEMTRMAKDFKALRGDIDITALPSGRGTSSEEIRASMEQALGARRALVERVESDPAGALHSGNPALVKEGAEYFLKDEARTSQAVARFGINSPEWKDVQQYALQTLLKSGMASKSMAKPGISGRTVSAAGLDDAISKYTASQQAALFSPGVLDDVKLLVREANLLFPELSTGAGSSMTAANILGHIGTKAGIKAWGYYQLLGALADSPGLMRVLTGTIRQDPYAGRGLLGWIMQGGLDTTLYRQQHSGTGEAEGASTFRSAMQPTPKPKLPASYGGVSE